MAEEVDEDTIEVTETVADLAEMSEEQRQEYCKKVIKAVADGFKEIAKINHKVKQARALKAYMAELKEQMDEIRTVVLFTIKPEFREMYLGLLDEFSELGL